MRIGIVFGIFMLLQRLFFGEFVKGAFQRIVGYEKGVSLVH
jgi:hypothetical protein